MPSRGYKKYMKKDTRQGGNPFIKIFIISFFGMLLLFTVLFNYVSKVVTVDTSIGDYKEQQGDDFEDKKIIDVNRLEMIKNEDQGRDFSDLMQKPSDEAPKTDSSENEQSYDSDNVVVQNSQDIVYKVYIGTYTSAEQAKVAKEIIQESGSGLNPIVKCIGANDYTLQAGSFKNKQSADAMLTSIQRSNLPGRIVKE